ncbi:MAG: hypothetical protein QOE53_736, partial [Pseudonocardiales bacterium]|nr:hypothetical protein [Pseudonocardiales bacterium]
VEQCYADGGNTYPAAAVTITGSGNITCGSGTTAATGTINVSPGNSLVLTPGATSYTIATTAGSPGNKTYTYDSATGQTS